MVKWGGGGTVTHRMGIRHEGLRQGGVLGEQWLPVHCEDVTPGSVISQFQEDRHYVSEQRLQGREQRPRDHHVENRGEWEPHPP